MATIDDVVKHYTPLVTMTGSGQEDRANAEAVYAFIQHRLDMAGYLPDVIGSMQTHEVIEKLALTKADIYDAVNKNNMKQRQAHRVYERRKAARILHRIETVQTKEEKITIIEALIHTPLYIGV